MTRLGSALFTGAPSQECRLGEDRVRQLPALPAEPPADARAWLDALYLGIVCCQTDRVGRLCRRARAPGWLLNRERLEKIS
ncbi:hypothetical protein ABT373_40695 [Streptomyces sp. NPDC000070]|uniref:hypothetical protein n=1 Tax=Streptomyces sp. NPDC000070 TaxID=3154240 RepID=UPI00331CA346